MDTIKTITPRVKNPFAADSVIKILNYRIQQEEQSSRLYHAMSMYLNDKGYMGSSKSWQRDFLPLVLLF